MIAMTGGTVMTIRQRALGPGTVWLQDGQVAYRQDKDREQG
jgi:hypothetical protein